MERLTDGKKERVDDRQWIKEEHASSGMKSLPPLFVAKSAQLLGLIVITLLPNPIRRNPRDPSSARLLLLVTVPNAMYGDAELHATSLLYVLLLVMDADAPNSFFTYLSTSFARSNPPCSQ